MAVVSELVSKFSFIGSLTPQKEFNANLKVSVGLLAGAATGLAAAAGGFFAWTASVLDTIDPIAQLNRETGVAVESIQTLGYVATVSGASSEAMSASLAGLAKVTGDASRGLGRGKKAFEELGISVTDSAGKVKTADVVLEELRQRFETLGTSMEQQKSIIASLGIDASLIQTLNLTSAEMENLTQEALGLGVVTKEQADNAAEFKDSLARLKFGLSSIQNAVAVGFAPAMTGLTDRFVGFLKVNKDLIQNGLTWLGEVLASVMGLLERFTPIILAVGAAFLVWKLATGGLAAILGVLSSPLVLIGIGITALLLIVDDLMVAFSGGESVIRDFFLAFLGVDIVPIMQGIVDGVAWMISAAIALLEPFFAVWGNMFDAVIKAFTGDFSGALDSLGAAFEGWAGIVQGIFTGLFDWLFGMWGNVLGFIRDSAMSILPAWATDLISTGGTTDSGAATITPGDAMAIGGASNSSVSNSVEQNVAVTVVSNDAKQAGAAVNDALQEQLRTAKTQANRGGR